MSNVVALKSPPLPADAADYLGPAEVLAARAHEVQALRSDGITVRAELALAFPYQPAAGDTLLVIGKGDAHYVIGVLRGTGRTLLALPGDVDLHAVGGTLTLSADRRVHLRSAEISLQSKTLRVLADAATQTFTSLCQSVASLLSVRAGEAHTLVEGATFTRAKSAAILTEETTTINGREIHLG